MNPWLPFNTAEDAQAWIDSVDAALGFPIPGSQTYSIVRENNGLVSVRVTDKALPYMTQDQIDSLIDHETAKAQGRIPEAL